MLLGKLTRPFAAITSRIQCLSSHGSTQISSHLLQTTSPCEPQLLSRCMASLARMHKVGERKRTKQKQAPILGGCPQLKGVVIKVMIRKPKKPNSANRKCVRVRLSNGAEASAYVPGEGHNLQEHSIVMVEGGRVQDVPGVKLNCVRGKYDLPHVKKKPT
ncbi:28S ribosomal protein S12, mitochondrial-like [Dreissena polymorpha]|uniref:Small ribosomal subunit protein uS12m n=1 Tax=Dreissena polymorpha TaxID=45954 RepID=A0A9D4KXX1_DREPO|nr:28S ribosomal protein S12, mitochondrial-like [Dreissena polymorpha]XP_052273576.1 28S ribosomal protein S12, mitochondrial-like [Dreissena polymorpha]KAH3847698.1 hypothetical protein DPMN_090029 [Dreissena polymorpha]